MVTSETPAERAGQEEPIGEEHIAIEKRRFEKEHGTEACPRCGGAHESLDLVSFYRPILDHEDGFAWRWWAACPTTGDPILVYDLDESE